MRLTTRDKFNLGPLKNEAKILFQTTYSNFFLSLLDLNNKVICFKSSGHIPDTHNKKKKKPLYNIGILMESLSHFLILYKIQKIVFEFRSRRARFYGNYLLEQFRLYNLFVKSFKFYMPVAHNGVKGRHIRYKKSHRRRRRKRRRR